MPHNNNMSTLYEICRAVNQSLDLEEVLQLILDRALSSVKGKIGWISLVKNKRLNVVVIKGVDRKGLKKNLRIGEGITGTAAETKQMCYAPDVSQIKNYYQVSEAIKSELALPLVAMGEVVGVLNVESTRKNGFNRNARALLAAFADEAAIAVKNALRFGTVNRAQGKLNRDLGEKVKNLQALAEISAAINGSLHLNQVLHLIIKHTSRLFPAQVCQLLLFDHDQEMLKVYNPSADQIKHRKYLYIKPGQGITGWVARYKMPLIVPDVSRDQRYLAFSPATKSELAVPMLKGSKLVGVLNLESSKRNAFQAKHQELLCILADQAVAAIENARLYEDLAKTRDQLVLHERMAAVGEVSSDMVHWLANKVAMIPDRLRFIRNQVEKASPAVREDLDVVDRNVRAVLNFKRELLGKNGTPAIKPVPAEPLVRAVLDKLEVPDRISINLRAAGYKPTVKGDPVQLTKIIHYLLENAVEAIPQGQKGKITIGLDRRGNQGIIAIKDNGSGIGQEQLSKIFNPFYSTKTSTGGTGMGLWFTYRTLQKMGGRIEVASRVRQGTTFRIMLPLAGKS